MNKDLEKKLFETFDYLAEVVKSMEVINMGEPLKSKNGMLCYVENALNCYKGLCRECVNNTKNQR